MTTNLDVVLGGILGENGTTYDYDNDYTYVDEQENRGAEAVLIPLLLSLVLFVGVPGNALVLGLLSLKRQCWSSSDIFILHLGLSDVLLLVTLPFWAAQASLPHGWCCGLFWCRINGAMFNISFYSGILLLACISAERYLSIVRSIYLFTQKTPRLAHIFCLLVWLVSVLLSIPDWVSMIYINEYNMYGDKVCSCIANVYRSKWLLPSRIIHHVAYVLPVIALIFFFYHILMHLKESRKAQKKLRLLMLILVLVLVFCLCWTPYNIALIVDTWKSRPKAHATPERTSLLATLTLACVHVCLRPLVYFALCEKFQEKTLGIVRCRTEECKEDLWELGVGRENVQEQSSDPEEMKQMDSVEQQLQQAQC